MQSPSPSGRARRPGLEKENMITAEPIAAAGSVSGLLDKVNAFIVAAKATAADGITWGEFGELLLALLRMVVSFLDAVSLMTGAEKKAFALDAIGRLFDAVADRAVPLAVYPLWLVARPAVRSLVLALAGGVLEQLLPIVRSSR
jgi:hypothetical protein